MTVSTASRAKLVAYIKAHKWWRTALPSKTAIKARGVFYASSFHEAEFYGRPLDTPFMLEVISPLFGDESHIMEMLELPLPPDNISGKERFALDAEMLKRARGLGYDSIALMTPAGYWDYLVKGKIPRSIEIQVFL